MSTPISGHINTDDLEDLELQHTNADIMFNINGENVGIPENYKEEVIEDNIGNKIYLVENYDSSAGSYEVKSDTYIIYSPHNYFNINNVQLNIIGTIYDPVQGGNVEATYEYIKQNPQTGRFALNQSFQNNRFIEEDITLSLVNLEILGNFNDIYGNIREHLPQPEKIYLICINEDILDEDDDVNDFLQLCAGVPPELSEVNQLYFPITGNDEINRFINNLDGKDYIKYTIHNIPDVSRDNNFSGTMTVSAGIDVELTEGRWIVYLIIKDVVDNYTGYCLSNPKTLTDRGKHTVELITSNNFEVNNE